MQISYDRESCQGHNRCYMLAPELFDVDDEGYAILRLGDGKVGDVSPELADKAQLAVDNCPEYAIKLIDES